MKKEATKKELLHCQLEHRHLTQLSWEHCDQKVWIFWKKNSFILSVFENVKPILPNTMLIFFLYIGTRNFSETFSFRKTKTFLIIVKWRGSAVWWEWSNFGQSRELRVTTRWYVYYLSGRLERNSFWWSTIFFAWNSASFSRKFFIKCFTNSNLQLYINIYLFIQRDRSRVSHRCCTKLSE